MRSVSFRDSVLYPAAYLVGLDPRRDFQSNQMASLVAFINLWVRRLWDKSDFPDWTTIEERTPANHVVGYDDTGKTPIGRVLKVFLSDPLATNVPVDTPFKLLDYGIHVGFDHGSSVWVKFQIRELQYTSRLWDATVTYRAGDLVYLPDTGECYSSIGNNNRGNYPGPVGQRTPVPTEVVQQAVQDVVGLPAVTKIVDISLDALVPDASGTVNTVQVFGDTPPVTSLGIDTYNGGASATKQDIRDGLVAALQADAGLSAFTITAEDTPVRIRLEAAMDFSVSPTPKSVSAGTGVSAYMKVSQVREYIPAVAGVTGKRQYVEVTLNVTSIIEGEVYTLTFVDSQGATHEIAYTAVKGDTVSSVLKAWMGLISIMVSTEPTFFSDVFASIDTTDNKLILSTGTTVAIDATMQRAPLPPAPVPPNPLVPVPPSFWFYVPFPQALAQAVVRGAYADYLKMEGQSDKGAAEEQGALGENAEVVKAKIAPPYPPLTDQQQPVPRLRAAG